MEARFTSRLLGRDIHENVSDYHLSPVLMIDGLSKTYLQTDPQMWFDLHLDVEVGIQVRGCSERKMGAHSRIVRPGDVWFVGIFERHGYRVVEPPCEVVVLIVSPATLANLALPEMPACNWLECFSQPPEKRPQTTDTFRPQVLDLARRLQTSLALDGGRGQLLLRLNLMELLLLYLSDEAGTRRSRTAQALQGPARIAPAVTLALQSRRLVSHDEAAAACGLGRHQFRRAFETVLGIPFAKFALHHRLQGAAADLIYTDAPTKAIATTWGFTDESHLNHSFTREYGSGPRAYRLQHRNASPGAIGVTGKQAPRRRQHHAPA